MSSIPFTKGHGTENDFVVVADPDGHLELTTPQVAWLCERRAGIGADGLIRVVRARYCPEAAPSLALDPGIEWFMDYRNADGSSAQMCGNGVRVFAAYLLREGLVDPQLVRPGTHGLAIATRAATELGWRAQRDVEQMCADEWRWRSANPNGYPDS